MIVKNEERCIERCLTSARPFIDYCVISDTGSEDGTISKIESVFKTLKLPGEIHSDKWVNFSHNRNLSLDRCLGKTDYILFMDADEVISEVKNYLPLKNDDYDGYTAKSQTADFEYDKVRIYKNNGTWMWRSPIHEYLYCNKTDASIEKTDIVFTDLGDGDRNVSGVKFYKDIIILEQEHAKNPDDERIVFYMGQTYEHMGCLEKAYEAYSKRVMLGRWEEEVYYSLFRMAEINYCLNRHDVFQSMNSYLTASAYKQDRLESLLSLCQKLREVEAWATIYSLTKDKRQIKNNDMLFVNRNAEWRIVEEHALAAYYLGRREEAKDNFNYILANYKLTPDDKLRLTNSASY